MTLHEAQAYYEDFEVQTLYYRAPEVVLGVKFNQQIDMVRTNTRDTVQPPSGAVWLRCALCPCTMQCGAILHVIKRFVLLCSSVQFCALCLLLFLFTFSGHLVVCWLNWRRASRCSTA